MTTKHTGANSSRNNFSWKTAKPQMCAWKEGKKNLTPPAPYIKKKKKLGQENQRNQYVIDFNIFSTIYV